MKRRTFVAAASAAAAGAALPISVLAQSWPTKTITWIYPYPAGGGADPLARTLAELVGRRLGQSIIVDNRAGASGMIGAAAVAKAPPDGYTFLVCVSTEIVINPWLYKKMAYDPQRDFAPVCRLTTLPLALVASTQSGIANIGDLITRAKAAPGRITYASAGAGSLQHLAGELLQRTASIRLTHVPYRGIAAATTDLLGGTVDVGFVGLSTALPHVQAGKLVGLGLSTAKPVAAAPSIRPLASFESIGSFDLTQWFGLLAPAATPAPIIDRMYREVAAVMQEPEVRNRVAAQGLEPALLPPSEFGEFVRDERERFGRIVRDANITIEQ
ncbi:MAG TPA: tripartite tricarboxylate transporter substrate binding protein [Burkholderiaceae bacterium]|nr:tripartite tricarboxylate transporter substrate binding protein [Burkholderiaceae bacterium]